MDKHENYILSFYRMTSLTGEKSRVYMHICIDKKILTFYAPPLLYSDLCNITSILENYT